MITGNTRPGGMDFRPLDYTFLGVRKKQKSKHEYLVFQYIFYCKNPNKHSIIQSGSWNTEIYHLK